MKRGAIGLGPNLLALDRHGLRPNAGSLKEVPDRPHHIDTKWLYVASGADHSGPSDHRCT